MTLCPHPVTSLSHLVGNKGPQVSIKINCESYAISASSVPYTLQNQSQSHVADGVKKGLEFVLKHNITFRVLGFS